MEIGRIVVGRYRIVDRIGEGGMGVVYRAVDEQLHRTIALKILSGQSPRDPAQLGRFRNEARALSALNHPHIITIHEIGEGSKDLGRSIDYLETRPDIDHDRIGYLGVSQGAAYGVILAALEDRLKTVVFLDGGYFQFERPVAGLDQVDFAARLRKPVLMVNGRFDATFPYETAQRPMFEAIATPAASKKHVVFDTPHDVRQRRPDLIREVLSWLDTHLGRVQ